MYVYELSSALVRRGHDVTVLSRTGGLISQRARANGVEVLDFEELPPGRRYDVLHVNELGPARIAMAHFPDTPVIASVHSQWPCEDPLVHDRIHKYVCIRPEVRDKIVGRDGIPLQKTAVVYNGVDFARFNVSEGAAERERDLVLFAGTVDPLRRAAAFHLIERSRAEDFDVLFIGTRHSTHLDGPLPENVQWIQGDVWNIEDYVRECTATAGVVLGRTTLEGWACGKPGWIYDIDLDGSIRSIECHPPPHRDILRQFDIEYMTDQIEALYAEAIGHTGAIEELRPARRAGLDLAPGRTATIAFAEEIVEEPVLARAWAAAVAADANATLVVYAGDGAVSEWAPRVEEALGVAGVDEFGDLDVLLVSAETVGLGEVAERASCVVTERPGRLPLVHLPHARRGDLHVVRAALGGSRAAA